MSRSGFFNKVQGEAFLGGQQVDLLSWLCLVRCPFLPFFAFLIHCCLLFKGGALFHGPHSETPCRNQRQIQREALFLKLVCFWDKKNSQNWDRFKVLNFFSFFDQVSFRSRVTPSSNSLASRAADIAVYLKCFFFLVYIQRYIRNLELLDKIAQQKVSFSK